MNFLETLLATMLPGDENWPSGPMVAADVAADAPDALLTLAAALPSFELGNEAALRAAEAAHPAAFERLVSAAYLAYYTAPPVRQVLARLTGYEDRPPQPRPMQAALPAPPQQPRGCTRPQPQASTSSPLVLHQAPLPAPAG